MEFDQYVRALPDQKASAHIELDPAKEAKYMREHTFLFKHTLRAIPVSPCPLRVLDIGTTPFTLFLKHAFPSYEVYTLDRTNLLKERCAAVGIELRNCNLDTDPIPFPDEYFDYIIFTEVLEHIFAPPSAVLGETWRKLRHAGTLALSVPNIANLLNRAKLLVGRTPLEDPDHQFKRDWVHGHGHLHEYAKAEIVAICQKAGFKLAKTDMLHIGPIDILRGELHFTLRRFVYHSMLAIFPNLRPTIYVICRK
jgi:SAM-dependent methyltransferase